MLAQEGKEIMELFLPSSEQNLVDNAGAQQERLEDLLAPARILRRSTGGHVTQVVMSAFAPITRFVLQ